MKGGVFLLPSKHPDPGRMLVRASLRPKCHYSSRGRRRSLNLPCSLFTTLKNHTYLFIAALDKYHRHFHIVHRIDLPKHILETGIERHSSHPAVGRRDGEEVQMLAPDSTHLFYMSFRIRLSTEMQFSSDRVGLQTSALVSASCFSRPFRT